VTASSRLNRTDGAARYATVAEWLRRRVDDELVAGQQLPSQRTLAREAGVTLMTLRRAIDLLIDEGILDAKQGIGTFVVAKPGDRIPALRSFSALMADQGATTLTKVLAAGSQPAPPAVASQLEIPAGRRVWYVERLRIVNGLPFTWQRSTQAILPVSAATRRRLQRESLYDILGEVGCLVGTARQDIRAIATPPAVADLLDVDPGTPCLAVERLTRDNGGRPVLHDEIYTRGDVGLLQTDVAAAALIARIDDRRGAGRYTGRH
jgi:DNA-binding GntR family transcriptional regulator